MRILIISDVHANWTALQAVLAAAGGIDRIVFLGDAVDFGPRPVECVDWVLKNADVLIRGNHDNAIGTDEGTHCSHALRAMAEATLKLHRTLLSETDQMLLCHLPLSAEFTADGARFHAVHAVGSDPLFRYLRHDITDTDLRSEVEGVDADIVLTGHTHRPRLLRVGHKMVVNPGSVGQPKDGDPRASFALWEDGSLTICRAKYDVARTVRELEEQPLPIGVTMGLSRVLLTGRV